MPGVVTKDKSVVHTVGARDKFGSFMERLEKHSRAVPGPSHYPTGITLATKRNPLVYKAARITEP